MSRSRPVPGTRDDNGGGPGSGSRRTALRCCVLALPLLLCLYGLLLYWSTPHTGGRELRIDQFLGRLREGRVQSAEILEFDDRVVGRSDGDRYWVALAAGHEALVSRLTSALDEAGVAYSVRQQPLRELVARAGLLVPALIVVDGVLVLFLLVGRSGDDGGDGLTGFGRSRARRVVPGEARVGFADVAGADEAIEELAEVRDYLGAPAKYRAVGAAVPKGILLTGPPGCGKTLLARALAGESQVPFFSISGSDFVEMFVGVGAARIRDLFADARAAAPCIVFIDELDAVGRNRGPAAMGGQDEREAALNQLLVQLDGFESGEGVVVLAATNRPDILDSALLRPGRFDRRVAVDRPDLRGREAVLRVHVRGKPLAADVDLAAVARRTAGFSGADLANVVNESALLAARRASTEIGNGHLAEAIERMVAGPERRSRILSPQDRFRIACHEAGHAVVSTALPGTDRVGKLSIVARGHAGGFTWWVPESDAVSVTRSELLDRIAALLGGRAAEELVTGEVSSGAESDLEAASLLARRMVTDLGMGEALGPYVVKPFVTGQGGDPAAGYSERVASAIDGEVQAILGRAAERAGQVLVEHRAVLDAVAGALLDAETVEGETLDGLLLSMGHLPSRTGAGPAPDHEGGST